MWQDLSRAPAPSTVRVVGMLLVTPCQRRETTMTSSGPVLDWANDYDLFDDTFVTEPYPIFAELRETCPVARTERWGGSWMPTRYADIAAVAHDTTHFSSRNVGVTGLEGASP